MDVGRGARGRFRGGDGIVHASTVTVVTGRRKTCGGTPADLGRKASVPDAAATAG
ncbi:hypothetical protein GCM10023085_73040 [Actinomadura viridis]